MKGDPLLFEFLCRFGDNALVLSHRLSEWCGVAPVLEEDIALANVALDLMGQAQMWLSYAAEVEDQGRTADDLAMRRDVFDFRNVLLVERPNGHFGETIMRQFLFDAWHLTSLSALQVSGNERVADIAAKSIKEVAYHVERSGDTVIGLGDGSELSHSKMQEALNELWPYVGEMCHDDQTDHEIASAGISPLPSSLREQYNSKLSQVLGDATLSVPSTEFAHSGGKDGFRHTEHLGHLLTQMQWLQRAYPGLEW